MLQLWTAVIGLGGVVVGALVGALGQAALQRRAWQRDELRRWQQDRRGAYLRLVDADDALYRALVREARDPVPGRGVLDPDRLGDGGAITRLTPEERTAALGALDAVWRAKREIELIHLSDDELLAAAERLAMVGADLAGLAVYDLDRRSGDRADVDARLWEGLQSRQRAIRAFMQQARVALAVPPGQRQ